jgi:hypothetical protein
MASDLNCSLTTPAAECGCAEHFSRVGDFSLDAAQPCELNILIIQILWCVQSVFWFVFLLGTCGTILVMVLKYHLIARRFRSELLVLTIKSVTAVCCCVVGILRAASPSSNVIGLDATTTWLFCIGATFFWFDMLSFFIVQTSTHLITLAVARSKNLAFVYTRLYPFLNIVACVGTLAPLGILYSTDPQLQYVYGLLHFVLLGVLLFLLIFTFVLAMEIVLREVRFAMLSNDAYGSSNVRSGSPSSSGSKKKAVQQAPAAASSSSSTASEPPDSKRSEAAPAVPPPAQPVPSAVEQKRKNVRSKLRLIEQQVVSFRRDGVFHLVSGPVSIAIGFSPFLMRYSSYYLPVIWSLAAFAAVRYSALSFVAVRGVGSKMASSHGVVVSNQEDSQGGEESDDVYPVHGLGIASSKSRRKPRWHARMSRITEKSETSRMISMEEQTSLGAVMEVDSFSKGS